MFFQRPIRVPKQFALPGIVHQSVRVRSSQIVGIFQQLKPSHGSLIGARGILLVNSFPARIAWI